MLSVRMVVQLVKVVPRAELRDPHVVAFTEEHTLRVETPLG